MDGDRPTAGTPAELAKAALRRLAQVRLEPTPVNFARAYAEESGQADPGEAGLPARPAVAGQPAKPTDAAQSSKLSDAGLPARVRPLLERLTMRAVDDAAQRGALVGQLMAGRWDEAQRQLERALSASASSGGAASPAADWPQTLERLLRGLERGGRHWTIARKKDSLQRLLDAARGDGARLQTRLQPMLAQWETDQPDARVEALQADAPPAAPASTTATTATATATATDATARLDHHPQVVSALQVTVAAGLPDDEPRARELAQTLGELADRIATEGATIGLAEAVGEVCLRARRLLGLRHELVNELLVLTRSLTEGLSELAEDGSWARGQGESLRQRLSGTANARAVKAARELLDHTRQQQQTLQRERQDARDALKQMVQQVLGELGALEGATGAFNDKVLGYAQVIEAADSLESLGRVVREMVSDSQAVHGVVSGARDRLASEHARGVALEAKVRDLEADLRRLSDEVSTDALTQVANRRGLTKVFDAERARTERDGPAAAPLAVALIDIDNFKKLNDTLGHAAGDVALKSLAARVKDWLRPVDHLARFGGEEFVVLLPGTPVDEAQQVLTRLQRKLTASLFMHDGKEVFVTFSAGVTAFRLGPLGQGEALELALERADEALYEAKRTGKNRTCIA